MFSRETPEAFRSTNGAHMQKSKLLFTSSIYKYILEIIILNYFSSSGQHPSNLQYIFDITYNDASLSDSIQLLKLLRKENIK